jgi:hypothetical protein
VRLQLRIELLAETRRSQKSIARVATLPSDFPASLQWRK